MNKEENIRESLKEAGIEFKMLENTVTHIEQIPEGFNPTVEGDLYITSLTSIPSDFNPTANMSKKKLSRFLNYLK